MKKLLVAALSATLCLGCLAMTGCGQSAEKSADKPADQKTEQSAQVANPVHETGKQGVLEATGIELNAPKGATDVTYSFIDNGDEKNQATAQMEYTVDGKRFCYRAQSVSDTKAVDISGMNYTWEKGGNQVLDVNEVEAHYQSCKDATVLYWLDVVPGVAYSLSTDGSVSEQDMVAAANAVFQTTQGEV
ncbi:MAG: hypothetical protein Q4D06_00925 [Coriobacteriia bacterium]|nr:hypothetical protein [Coriobacteriia bacterium]